MPLGWKTLHSRAEVGIVKEMHILDHSGFWSQIIFSSLLFVKHVKGSIKHRSLLLRNIGADPRLHLQQNLLVLYVSGPGKTSLAGAALWELGSGYQYVVWKMSRFRAWQRSSHSMKHKMWYKLNCVAVSEAEISTRLSHCTLPGRGGEAGCVSVCR